MINTILFDFRWTTSGCWARSPISSGTCPSPASSHRWTRWGRIQISLCQTFLQIWVRLDPHPESINPDLNPNPGLESQIVKSGKNRCKSWCCFHDEFGNSKENVRTNGGSGFTFKRGYWFQALGPLCSVLSDIRTVIPSWNFNLFTNIFACPGAVLLKIVSAGWFFLFTKQFFCNNRPRWTVTSWSRRKLRQE